ncbi:uncharacterized [Tachysurus ichikawai]
MSSPVLTHLSPTSASEAALPARSLTEGTLKAISYLAYHQRRGSKTTPYWRTDPSKSRARDGAGEGSTWHVCGLEPHLTWRLDEYSSTNRCSLSCTGVLIQCELW